MDDSKDEKAALDSLRSIHCHGPGCNDRPRGYRWDAYAGRYCSEECFKKHLELNRQTARKRIDDYLRRKGFPV